MPGVDRADRADRAGAWGLADCHFGTHMSVLHANMDI
jgi:hypothetical protein